MYTYINISQSWLANSDAYSDNSFFSGKVYKGVLSNGLDVAVKHIINDGCVSIETFVREVTSLSHVRHPNLVALIGHCEDAEECFLVYELCHNGNLSEWLFGMFPFPFSNHFLYHFHQWDTQLKADYR